MNPVVNAQMKAFEKTNPQFTLKDHEWFAQVLDEMIQKQGITEREKIRDFIRGDGVCKAFDAELDKWLLE